MMYCPSVAYREAIRSRKLHNTVNESSLVGYVLDENGYHTGKILLPNDIEKIAEFIVSDNHDKLLCTLDDYLVLNTMGEYIDLCSDEEYLETIRPILIKKQRELEAKSK